MNETWWVNQSELDSSQEEVIELGPNGSYLVVGPPGSGKTNLLLLRANYLCLSSKPDVLILVFTRTLKEFIASGASRYSFSPDKVQTYMGWAKRLLAEHGVGTAFSENFDEDRKRVLAELNDLVKRQQLSKLYDVILIDEAHDYLPDELRLLRSLGSSFFAVADLRQQIYRKDPTIDAIETLVDRKIELKYHYRNGLQICRLADGIMKGKGMFSPLVPTANYDEKARPSSVHHFKCENMGEQGQRIISEIELQRKAYPDELIGIICPRREELQALQKILSNSPLASFCIFQGLDGYVPFNSVGTVCVSTLHSAKGLEFRALHFAACDTLKSFTLTNRSMAFTGVTRAKTSLSLYYSEDLFGYLEKALMSLAFVKQRPRISEAFGPSRG